MVRVLRQLCNNTVLRQMRLNRLRQLVPNTVLLQQRPRLRGIPQRRRGGATGDGRNIVADHIRQDQSRDTVRCRMAQHPAAFDLRQLLSDEVHLRDVHPA